MRAQTSIDASAINTGNAGAENSSAILCLIQGLETLSYNMGVLVLVFNNNRI